MITFDKEARMKLQEIIFLNCLKSTFIWLKVQDWLEENGCEVTDNTGCQKYKGQVIIECPWSLGQLSPEYLVLPQELAENILILGGVPC